VNRRRAETAGGAPPSGPRPPPARGLDTPENVAAFIAWLLLECPGDEFGAQDWDVQDPSHHARWMR